MPTDSCSSEIISTAITYAFYVYAKRHRTQRGENRQIDEKVILAGASEPNT